MRLRKPIIFTIVILAFAGCKNLEDAELTTRDTFIHFYEESTNLIGIAAEPLPDGYLLACNLQGNLEFSSIISRTDLKGNVIWQTVIPNSSASALKVVSDGYLILGDSIEVDPLAAQVTDIIKSKARLMKIDGAGNIIPNQDISWSAPGNNIYFHGNAITLDASGEVVILGTIDAPNTPSRSFVSAHDPNSLSMVWSQTYSYDNRDFVNSKSVHITNDQKIIWASSALDDQSSTKKSYLLVPFVAPNSTFVNGGLFGQNDDLFYSSDDIQPSGIGFGIIGTFSNIQSQNKNIYFLRTDPSGNIISGSQMFFDGILSANNIPLANPTDSESQDTGNAIISTRDGGYLLAGSMESTTTRGNGGKDILLIRLDPFGNMIWNKIIGGTGDEVPNTIRLTADDGFLICGSVSISGLSAAFLIKTDKNGELHN